MGDIVFAAAMSHAPGITAFPDAAPAAQKAALYRALAEVRRGLERARPDVLVVFSSDHFTNLFVTPMPAFCVGLGERYRGPAEDWIRIDQFEVAGAPGLARHLTQAAYEAGIEPAFAERLVLEHGVVIPLHFLTPSMTIPIVPVLQNCLVPPLPRLDRCHRLGAVFAAAIRSRPERVAVIGTGGLSHAPGAPEAGLIDQDFDRLFLRLLESGDGRALAALPDDRVNAAGFGTWEIRQWLAVAGAVAGRRARVLAYEPVKEWDTGCGIVVFE